MNPIILNKRIELYLKLGKVGESVSKKSKFKSCASTFNSIKQFKNAGLITVSKEGRILVTNYTDKGQGILKDLDKLHKLLTKE